MLTRVLCDILKIGEPRKFFIIVKGIHSLLFIIKWCLVLLYFYRLKPLVILSGIHYVILVVILSGIYILSRECHIIYPV